jgi:hypothetical protein
MQSATNAEKWEVLLKNSVFILAKSPEFSQILTPIDGTGPFQLLHDPVQRLLPLS